MAQNDGQVLKSLGLLYRISEAGEKGFATASTNIHNPGVKVLFKSFAQQRAGFKEEILAEMHRLGYEGTPRGSLRGMIHRGGFAIFAGMTIGAENQEQVILKEAARGERVAVQTYGRVLQRDLPEKVRTMVQSQLDEIRKVAEQVNLMRGKENKQMVVRLFESEQDTAKAIKGLKDAGFSTSNIQRMDLDEAVDLYQGRGATAMETVIAGAFYGLLLGVLIGILAGVGIVQSNSTEPTGFISSQGTLVLLILSICIVGALVGGALAFFLGAGISEEDTYRYKQSMHRGEILVYTICDQSQADRAGQIMDRANTGSNQIVLNEPA